MGGAQLVGRWVESYTGMSADNIKGLLLALSSSLFIGASFIVKKKGLKKAGASGVRAGEAPFGTSGSASAWDQVASLLRTSPAGCEFPAVSLPACLVCCLIRSVSCARVGSRLQCRWVSVSCGSGARLGLGTVSAEHIGDRLGRAKHELGFYLELVC